MDYKALYEAQLKENEKLKSELEFFKKATEVYEDICAGEGGFIDEKKKLQEENEKLKAEVEEWKQACDNAGTFIETPDELGSWLSASIHEDDEEYSKYMEPLQLRRFALKVHNFAYGTEWDDEYIVGAMDFDGIIEKLKKDEKELTDQLEKYKVWIENVWDLIYWSEKADEEIRTSEIVESCGYCENLEYIKNELVDDPDKEE